MSHTTRFAISSPRLQGQSQDIYIDPVSGDDDGHGTQSDPILTHVELDRRIPDFNDAVTRVFLKSGAPHVIVPMRTRVGTAAMVFANDPIWDPASRTITGGPTAALVGTTANITKSSGLTVNQFRGHTIEYTSGPATGFRRTIRDNDATDIHVCFNFNTAPVDGNTYIIYRPNVILNVTASQPLTADGWNWLTYFAPVAGSDNPEAPVLLFSGLRFQEPNDRQSFLHISGQHRTAFYGCEYEGLFNRRCEINAEESEVTIGSDNGGQNEAHLPALLGETNIFKWAGWGFADNSTTGSGLGILTHDMQTNSYVAKRLFARRCVFSGGSILASGSESACVIVQASPGGPGQFTARSLGGSTVKFEHTGTGRGVFVGGMSLASMSQTDVQTTSGDALFVQGLGQMSIANSVTGQSLTGASVRCQEGRVIITGGVPVFGDVAALDYDVGNGSPKNKNFFASAGDSMINLTDLSMIKRRT